MSDSRDTIQSVERAIDVLTVLGTAAEGLSHTEIAQRTGLHKATTSRILKTLVKRRFVKQNADTLRYSLGLAVLELSFDHLSGMDLRRAALPHLQALQVATGETVNLAILDEHDVIYIDRVESQQMLRTSSTLGKRTPAFCTSLGRAILAFTDPDLTHAILRSGRLPKITPHTLTNPIKIEEHLEVIRKTGVALDDRENQEHVRCIGAPIFDASGHVAGAVSISGPASRVIFDENQVIQVKGTARAISSDLGWGGKTTPSG